GAHDATQRNTLAASPPSARATVVPPKAVHRDLQLRQLLLEREKQCVCSLSRSQLVSMQGKLERPQATLPETLLVAVEAPQKLLAIERPEPSAGPLVMTGFEPGQLVSLPDSRLHLAKGSPVPLARGPRCSQGPGPCASSLGKQVVRKYNLAARCGDRPIFARCRPPRNQRVPARCDNRRSHWQRKRARPNGPFLIAALDRCLCLPRQIED